METSGIHIIMSQADIFELKRQIGLIAFFYVIAFTAMLIDLRSGIQKAKRLGLARTSKGFRMTIIKINQYLLLMMLLSLVDISKTLVGFLNIFGWRDMPWLTFLGAIVICLIELKSVWENTQRGNKKEIAEAVRGLIKLLRTKDDKDEVVGLLNKAFAEETKDNEDKKE